MPIGIMNDVVTKHRNDACLLSNLLDSFILIRILVLRIKLQAYHIFFWKKKLKETTLSLAYSNLVAYILFVFFIIVVLLIDLVGYEKLMRLKRKRVIRERKMINIINNNNNNNNNNNHNNNNKNKNNNKIAN
jgi:hypothetical protein